MRNFTLFESVRHYAGKVRTLRNEARTERVLSQLPAHIRKDIGWPDSNERQTRGS